MKQAAEPSHAEAWGGVGISTAPASWVTKDEAPPSSGIARVRRKGGPKSQLNFGLALRDGARRRCR